MSRWLAVMIGLVVLGAVSIWSAPRLVGQVAPPVRVGILHSQTSPMELGERSLIDAEVLALEEIREAGLLGRKLEWVIADGQSDPRVFAREARRLIEVEKVSVIFGCGTSSARRTIRPVIEEENHLLFFPVAYEGLEESPNIFYTGAAPNQQIIPTLKWAYDKLNARKFFLVGTDSIYSHGLNEIVKDLIKSLQAEVAGEEYILWNSGRVDGVVAKIQQAKPDVVICSLLGETNLPFFQRLRSSGVRPEQCPVISYPLTEHELRAFDASDVVGDYITVSYAQSIKTPENLEFVRKFQARFGPDRVTGDTIDAAYNSVRLWAQAVTEAESEKPEIVRKFLGRQSLNAPEGIISIDAATHHTWRPSFIGKIRPDKLVDIVWTSETPIRPDPFPPSRSRADWQAFLDDLSQRWGGNWINLSH
jgi:urea transport system substrate-binding protein